MNSNQLRQLASQAASNSSVLRSKINAANRTVAKAGNTWKGESSTAFKDAWKKSQNRVQRIAGDMNTLKSRLDALAQRVRQAEAKA
jgi:WXG100 family type VII secretion target